MKKIFLFSLLVSGLPLASLPALAQTELKGSPEALREFLHPDGKSVTLRGHAEKTAFADKAVVSLVVSNEAKTLSEAMDANSELREKIIRQLIDKGIAKDQINNAKFSSSPQYGWFGKKPSSFKVVNRIAVNVFSEAALKDIARVADLYDEASLGATNFEHTQRADFEAAVKKEALANILQQKSFYEQSLGVRLIPLSFREGTVGINATAGAGEVEEVVVTGMRVGASSYKDDSDYRRDPSFDELKYTANVEVDYQVDKTQ